jgi:hypothetical protein
MSSSFRMFKARGQPGCWFGYAEIDGVTYKIDARHVGKGVAKHFEGTIKRHLKADQGQLALGTPTAAGRLMDVVEAAITKRVDNELISQLMPDETRRRFMDGATDPDLNDEIPF